MKLARDFAIVALTALLVAPLARPRAAHADGEEKPAPPPPAVFDADGVRVTVSGRPPAAGAEAAATLKAVNTHDTIVVRKVRVAMTVTPKVSLMSRMIRLPEEKWTREITLKLAAGETRTVALRTAVKLADGEIATFAAGPKGTVALASLAVPPVLERLRAKTP